MKKFPYPVVITTSFMGDIRHSGGVGRHIQLLAKGFAEMGYEVKIIDRRSLGLTAARLFSFPKVFNWIAPDLGTAVWALTAGWVQRVLVWFIHRGRALWIFEDAYGFLADKKPCVLFIHSLESDVKKTLHGDKGLAGWVVRCLRGREEGALKAAGCAITVSNEYAEIIKKEFSLDVPVVLNAIDFDHDTGKDYGDGKLELIAVGVVDKRKNFNFLIEVMQELAVADVDARLSIVGEGPLRGQLKDEVAARGLDDRITVAGYISAAELDSCYRRAHLMLHPSLHETFGFVLLEARKYGLVTLVTDYISVPDELCDHRLPLVKSVWAECVRKYVRDRALAASTGRRGYLMVKDKYSVKNMAESVLKLAGESR